MGLNWSNIICIEVKKYNDQQLEVIEIQLGAIPDVLKMIKAGGTTKIWVEHGEGIIAYLEKKELWDNYDVPLYKGLLVTQRYSPLTKKDKDKLLKMKPVEFNTKKSSIKKVASVASDIELSVDDILDKISQLGINSLSKEEKDFLDKISRQ